MNSFEFGHSAEWLEAIKPMDLGWKPYYDGRYWQPHNPAVVESRRATTAAVLDDPSSMTLRQYQDFAELDWLRPHGDIRTALALKAHLFDEYHELVESTDESTRRPIAASRVEKLTDNDSAGIVSELGDILWIMSGLATCGGLEIEKVWEEEIEVRLPCRQSFSTVRDIDMLITEGYEPTIGSFELDEDIAVDLLYAIGFFAVGTTIIIQENSETSLRFVRDKQQNVSKWAAQGIGLIAYKAQAVGASFADVVQRNIEKVTARAESGRLATKEGRTPSEL